MCSNKTAYKNGLRFTNPWGLLEKHTKKWAVGNSPSLDLSYLQIIFSFAIQHLNNQQVRLPWESVVKTLPFQYRGIGLSLLRELTQGTCGVVLKKKKLKKKWTPFLGQGPTCKRPTSLPWSIGCDLFVRHLQGPSPLTPIQLRRWRESGEEAPGEAAGLGMAAQKCKPRRCSSVPAY